MQFCSSGIAMFRYPQTKSYVSTIISAIMQAKFRLSSPIIAIDLNNIYSRRTYNDDEIYAGNCEMLVKHGI